MVQVAKNAMGPFALDNVWSRFYTEVRYCGKPKSINSWLAIHKNTFK